jgi:hypothetical protein
MKEPININRVSLMYAWRTCGHQHKTGTSKDKKKDVSKRAGGKEKELVELQTSATTLAGTTLKRGKRTRGRKAVTGMGSTSVIQ